MSDRETTRSGLRGNGRSASKGSAWHSYASFRDWLLSHGGQADPKVRLQVAADIAQHADSQMMPQVILALGDTNPLVRHTALLLLRTLFHRSSARRDIQLRLAVESRETIQAVANCLEDEQRENMVAAYVALHCIWTPAAQQAIHDWRERCNTAQRPNP